MAKQKIWVVEVKAEIKNFSDDGFDIEKKPEIVNLVKSGLDIGDTFSGTLGEFKTKIKSLKVRLQKKVRP